MIDKIDKVKKLLEKLPVDYADIRIVKGPFTSLSIRDGKVVEVVESSNFGMGIRVLYSGSFGFASTNREDELERTAEKALKLARTAEGKVKLSCEKTYTERVEFKVRKNPKDFSGQSRKEMLE